MGGEITTINIISSYDRESYRLSLHIYLSNNIKGDVQHQEKADSHLYWGLFRSEH